MSIPDEKIYPEATGEAAKVVALHQDPQELVFYSGWVSSTCPDHAYSLLNAALDS